MDFVGNLSLFAAVKKITNRSRIDKVIAMVRLAQFFDSQCIYDVSGDTATHIPSFSTKLYQFLSVVSEF